MMIGRDLLKYSRKQRRINLFFNFLKIIVVVFALLGSYIYIGALDRFFIKDVLVVGAKTVNEATLASLVSSKIKDRRNFLIVPLDSYFFYPQEEIVKSIDESFPRIKKTELSFKNNLLILSLEEREPKYLLCSYGKDTVDKQCFYLNEEGYVFDKSPIFSGYTFFEFVLGEDYKLPEIGEYFLNKDIFSVSIAIKNVVDEIIKSDDNFNNAKLVSVLIKKDMEVEMNILQNENIWKILIDLKNVIDEQSGFLDKISDLSTNLKTALSSSFFEKDLNSSNALDYIDLRIENKVFYKFK